MATKMLPKPFLEPRWFQKTGLDLGRKIPSFTMPGVGGVEIGRGCGKIPSSSGKIPSIAGETPLLTTHHSKPQSWCLHSVPAHKNPRDREVPETVILERDLCPWFDSKKPWFHPWVTLDNLGKCIQVYRFPVLFSGKFGEKN